MSRRGNAAIDLEVVGPDDWRLWRELRLQALTDAPDVFGSTLAQWTGPGDTEVRWRARLTDVALNVVLRWDRSPAGMVSGQLLGRGEVELISMWVTPLARGRGVGDAAVRAVLEWAGQRAVVLAVRADNRRAIGLYRRHGFIDAGQCADDADELSMRRPAYPLSHE